MSTQAKALPDNLDTFSQRADFKQVNSDETIKTLQAKLDESDVARASDDDKAALVWRLMDHQGVDFSVGEGDMVTETDVKPSDDDTQASTAPADLLEITDTDSDDSTEISKAETERNTAEATPAGDDYMQQHRQAVVQRQQNRQAAWAQRMNENAISTIARLSVTNTGQYSVFEPASQTMIESGQTVIINPTPVASMSRVQANIKQINELRGNILTIN